MQISELTRLKHLEAENQRLKQLHAEPGKPRQQKGVAKKVTAPAPRRQAAHQLVAQGLSQRRACRTPTQNAYSGRFNGSFRREVLDAYLFVTLRQVRLQ